MPVYDFRCECGVVTEARAALEVMTLRCPACGQSAVRQAVYRVAVASTALPTRAGVHSHRRGERQRLRDFQEASQEVDHAYTRDEGQLGHAIERPDYWQIAKERVAKLRRAGVKSLDEVRR